MISLNSNFRLMRAAPNQIHHTQTLPMRQCVYALDVSIWLATSNLIANAKLLYPPATRPQNCSPLSSSSEDRNREHNRENYPIWLQFPCRLLQNAGDSYLSSHCLVDMGLAWNWCIFRDTRISISDGANSKTIWTQFTPSVNLPNMTETQISFVCWKKHHGELHSSTWITDHSTSIWNDGNGWISNIAVAITNNRQIHLNCVSEWRLSGGTFGCLSAWVPFVTVIFPLVRHIVYEADKCPFIPSSILHASESASTERRSILSTLNNVRIFPRLCGGRETAKHRHEENCAPTIRIQERVCISLGQWNGVAFRLFEISLRCTLKFSDIFQVNAQFTRQLAMLHSIFKSVDHTFILSLELNSIIFNSELSQIGRKRCLPLFDHFKWENGRSIQEVFLVFQIITHSKKRPNWTESNKKIECFFNV